jgi:hypothetical protein
MREAPALAGASHVVSDSYPIAQLYFRQDFAMS